MTYNIFNRTAPAMPKPSKGTECCKLLLSKASKDMQDPLIPMAIPALSAYLADVKFMYCDNKYYELCGQMGHLIGPSGIGKAQLSRLIEAIMRHFRSHDEGEYKKLVEWQRLIKTKGANKEKPERPEVGWFPPADLTNPAFIQNAMALESMGHRTQYLNLPEVEMADRMCGSHKQVSQMIRNIYDRQRAGALRATSEGVTGNPILRVNMTFSSTPDAARSFYKKDLTNGFFGRIPFAYKARSERNGRIPRQGQFDEEFLGELDKYIERLQNCNGRFIVKPLNKIADQLLRDLATNNDQNLPTTRQASPHRGVDVSRTERVHFKMYPDQDVPGETLFMQLKEVLPTLEHLQLPPGCKDFSDYYLQCRRKEAANG